MAKNRAEMVAKGQGKLQRKAGTMKQNYDSSKTRASQHYADVGFRASRVQAYQAGIQAANYQAPDPSKWAENWAAAMF